MGQPLEVFTLTIDVEPFVDRKVAAFKAHKTQQPADGEPEFIQDPELRRQFGQLERYILASTTNGASDPLQLLASELSHS